MSALARRATSGLLLAGVLGLGACAGYRSGWESLAYVGEVPPPAPPVARSAYEAESRPPLTAPGLAFKVWLDNRLQTSDVQVAMAVVPTQVDLREQSARGASPQRTQVLLRVTVLAPGFVFDPGRAVLEVGEARHAGVEGGVSVPFVLPADGVYRGIAPAPARIEGPATLAAVGQTYQLSLAFAAPTPTPLRADLALDLSQALRAPGQPPLPLVRFLPIRWRAGYT